jgi:hypothetical protein
MQINQIVIWGHKLHTHTHSYIHNGFFIGFNHIGYNTQWYDDNDDVSTVDFSNSLFITEHQVNKKIPCRTDCLYLTHYVDAGDFPGVPKEHIILLKVALRDFKGHDAKYPNCIYTPLYYGNKHEYYSKINGYNCLYMYWATDLLPDEIQENIENLTEIVTNREINMIGTITRPWMYLSQLCRDKNIQFNQYGASFNVHSQKNKSIQENVRLIKQSLIAPALQDMQQCQENYIPCRIFKNISYGKMGITNNPIVYELFDKKILYDSNLQKLFNTALDFEQREDKHVIIKELMEHVRDNHTYINRINTILTFIQEYILCSK